MGVRHSSNWMLLRVAEDQHGELHAVLIHVHGRAGYADAAQHRLGTGRSVAGC
jgi:hypothetical protein